MHHMAKLLPALLLGSVLGGCSMAGTGDFFADEYANVQRTQMPHYYGPPQNNCAPSYAPAPQNSCGASAVTPDAHSYGHSVQNQYGQAQYGQPQYGHNTSGHGAYVPPTYGAHSNGLRGKSNGFKPHAYGNLGLVNYEVGEDLYGAQARLGYQFNKFLAAEAEGSIGLSNDENDAVFGGVPVEQTLGIENSIAAFGVLRYPLFGKLSAYGRLGYHQTEIDQKLTTGTADPVRSEFSVNGVAYGSGLEYAVSPNTAIRLDYTSYDYDGPDADTLSLAVARKF